MALPLPDNTSKTHTGNTFLGTRPGTITKKSIRSKAKKDTAAANSRSAVVNTFIARQLNDIRSLRNVHTQMSAMPTPNLTNAAPSRGFHYSFKGLGQYSGAGANARESDAFAVSAKAYKDANGNMLGAQARIRASQDNLGKNYLANYTLDQDTHDSYIALGEQWKDDLKMFERYTLATSGQLQLSEQEAADLEKAIKRWQDYYKKYAVPKRIYNLETGKYEDTNVLRSDAPLPPWVAPTARNRDIWRYYTEYIDATRNIQIEALDNAKEQRDLAEKYNYKSAFSGDVTHSRGVSDSLVDAVIADIGDSNTLSSSSMGSHTLEYLQEYVVNPLRAGKFGVVAANRLYSLMDAMDAFARGSRAIAAGQTALGGRTEFEDQAAYWAHVDGYDDKEVRRAQRLFLDNGGFELLAKSHPELINTDDKRFITSDTFNMSESALEAKITLALDAANIKVPWREVRDVIEKEYFGRTLSERASQFKEHAVENLKDAYTVAGVDFNADTGSVLGDMVVEMATDPGFVVGGLAKSIAKNGVKEITSNVFRHGITESFKGVDVNRLLSNKEVRAALNSLSSANDGKYLIFRNSDDIVNSVDIFVERLKNSSIDAFKNKNQLKRFGDILKTDLLEQRRVMNANILAATPKADRALSNKTLKVATMLDHAVDNIDVALIKTAFPEPFLIKDAARLSRKGLAASSLGKYIKNKKLRMDEVVRAVTSADSDGIRVATDKLQQIRSLSGSSDKDIQSGVRAITSKFESTANSMADAIRGMREGRMTIDDASEAIDQYIKMLSNGDFKSIDELKSWVSSLDTLYKAEYENGLDIVIRQYEEFQTMASRLQSQINTAFIDELRALPEGSRFSDYSKIFEKYSSSVEMLALRDQLSTVIPKAWVDDLIRQSDTVINSGLSIRGVDVIAGLESVAKAANTDVVVREMPKGVINKLINRRPLLKQAMRQGGKSGISPSYAWAVRQLYYLTRRSASLNMDVVYKAFDSSIRNVFQLYLESGKEVSKRNPELRALLQELLSLQDTVRSLDTVAVNNVTSITGFHADILSTFNGLLRDSNIQNMIRSCDKLEAIADVELDMCNVSDYQAASTLMYNLKQIAIHRKHLRAYESFDTQLRAVPGMTETKLYAVESALLNAKIGTRDIFDEITRRPDGVWDYLNEIVYNNSKSSVLNMKTLNEHMRSLLTSKPTDLFENSKFVEELQDPKNKDVRKWFENLLNQSNADPQAYVDKQMLAIMLIDPDSVRTYNKLAAEGETPIFVHLSSTGLNADVDSITGIGYRKWVPVADPDNITLADIKAIMSEPSVDLKVRLSDADIKNVSYSTLRAVFDSDEPLSVLRTRYKQLFGRRGNKAIRNESELLEDFFKSLYDAGIERDGYRFIVHDLESVTGANGYNMRLLNRRAGLAVASDNPYTARYANNLAGKSSINSINTLEGLRRKVPDNGFTDDEFYEVEKLIKQYALKRKEAGRLSTDLSDFDGLRNRIAYIKDNAPHLRTEEPAQPDTLSAVLGALPELKFDADGVREAVTNAETINSIAKRYMSVTGPKRLGSVQFTDAAYQKHMKTHVESAFRNISEILGIDLGFDYMPASYGYAAWAESYSNKVSLNPYAYSGEGIFTTFMHELRHVWSMTDDFGSGFKSHVKDNILQVISPDEVIDISNTGKFSSENLSRSDVALRVYIIQQSRYGGLKPLDNGWMEEFVAPIFQTYFSDTKALTNMKHYMKKAGYADTVEGRAALSFMDSLHTIYRNNKHLTSWSGGRMGVHADPEFIEPLIRDCLYSLTTDEAIMDEFAKSLLNVVSNKDALRQSLLNTLQAGNDVSLARQVTNMPVINAQFKLQIKEIRNFFNLGDTAKFGKLFKNDAIAVSVPTLQKMDDIAEHIKQIRNYDLTSAAESVLAPYSDGFVDFINQIKQVAVLSTGAGSSRFDYIRYIDVSNLHSASDRFLLAQQLFDDVFNDVDDLYSMTISSFKSDIFDLVDSDALDSDVLDILRGQLDLKIYKSGNIKDGYMRRFKHTVDSMEEELNIAREYKSATHDIASHMRQREHASLRLQLNGIQTMQDHIIGKAYQSVLTTLEDIGDFLVSPKKEGRSIVKKLSATYNEVLQHYRFDRLKTADEFDPDKLISELLWNGHNHIAFQSAYYTDDEIRALEEFVNSLKDKGINYISSGYDGVSGKYYIYLNNNCKVYRDTSQVVEKRYIQLVGDNKHSSYYTRPEFDNLHSREQLVDPFVESDASDPFTLIFQDETAAKVTELFDAWKSIDILSNGASRGTSGRVLSRRELEHYYNTLPAFMKDMASPENLQHMDDSLIYDPGFIIDGNTDYFLDMLDTMHYQNRVMNQGTATLAYMFGNGAPTQFGHLMYDVPDADIMNFFRSDSDFVVATTIPNGSFIHGVEVKQLRMDTPRAIEYARQTDNTVILPHDVYMDLITDINISKNPNSIRSTLNKALLVIKAFQLCNIGSWVRNWYDATKKAAMDMGADPSNTWTLLMYQGKAMKDMSVYRKILKAYGSDLDEASFEIARRTFKSDMTFQDYEMLSNLFHSETLTLDSKYFRNNKQQLISGQEFGVRGFSESDINDAFNRTYGADESLPLTKERFIEIHQHRGAAPTAVEQVHFDSMVGNIDQYIRSTRLRFTPQKAINVLFHPFSVSENIVRYSQMQYLRDFGMTNSQAAKRIHLTQFMSRRSPDALNYLEYVIPYANYTFDNMKYWVRMMEQNPRYFKYFSDAYGNIATDHVEDLLDKGQQFDEDRDAMVKTGGIPIGNSGMYFKLNPSFFDFIQNMYGGTTNLLNRLNPLLNLATRHTMAEYGLYSKYFFSDLDLNVNEDDFAYQVSAVTPAVNRVYNYYRQFKHVSDYFGNNAGLSTKLIFTVFSSLIGLQVQYGRPDNIDFDDWQAELAEQGKWFDANRGTVVSLDEKNESGANDPNISWEDRQMYQLIHFGKVWDGNQGKFVHYWDYIPGGFNEVFDFDNDPTAWDRLEKLYRDKKGKVFDYNTRHFVYPLDLTPGDLNDPNIDWETRCALMLQIHGKVWDANRQHFVNQADFMTGGLNDPNLNGRQKAALRLALFGIAWDDDARAYVKVQEPTVVTFDKLFNNSSDNLYSMLGIPNLANLSEKVHVNSDGLMVTESGKLVLTDNMEYNSKVFQNLLYGVPVYRGRNYNGYKRRSYSKLYNRSKKIYKGRTLGTSYYTGYGWNDKEGYYRFQYNFNYQYHNPQPGRKLHRLLSPRITYPYGGGYNKYSFYTR